MFTTAQRSQINAICHFIKYQALVYWPKQSTFCTQMGYVRQMLMEKLKKGEIKVFLMHRDTNIIMHAGISTYK